MTDGAIGPGASESEIELAARRLPGRSFGDINEDIHGMSGASRVTTKHGTSRVIEDGFFGIDSNSSPKPDFPEAGVELKVTPLNPTGDGTLVRPKERLVLCMVDYHNIAEAEYWTEVPELEKKLSKMLIVWYVHLTGIDRTKYPIVWIDLWEPDEGWSARFQKDFMEIKERVLAGEVPSERHVEYLGTCPKHGGGFKKEDPASSPRSAKVAPEDHPVLDHAEKRGWSICLGGMMDFILDSTDLPLSSQGRSKGINIYDLQEAARRESIGEFDGFADYITEVQ